jgi:hypothetical protein
VQEVINFYMEREERKAEHYSSLKMILRIATLAIAIWALVVAYQAKTVADWVNTKQDNIIERLIFK